MKNLKNLPTPALKHRWKLLFHTSDQKVSDLISTQAVRCSINYVDRLFYFTVQQDQDSAVFHNLFHHLAGSKDRCSMVVQTLNGDGVPTNNIKITGKLHTHHFDFDYGSAEVAEHTVCFYACNFVISKPSSKDTYKKFIDSEAPPF